MDPALRARLRLRLAEVDVRHPHRPGDRRAAVLLPLLDRGEPVLLGIWRAERGAHGGQFAFPGGRLEPGDRDGLAAALREAEEEVGLAEGVEILGHLGEFNTQASRHRVDVHVAYVESPGPWRLEEAEVAAVLEIPLARLLELDGAPAPGAEPPEDWSHRLPLDQGFEFDPAPFLVAGRLPARGRGHRLRLGDRVVEAPCIWGLSARILHDFLHRVWRPATGD